MIVIAVVCVALADEAFEWRKDAWSCSSTSPHREACVGEIGGAGIAAERALKLLSDELGESATQKASISGYLFGRRRRRRNRSTRRKKRQRRTRRKSRKSKMRQRRTRRKSRKSKKRQRRTRKKSKKVPRSSGCVFTNTARKHYWFLNADMTRHFMNGFIYTRCVTNAFVATKARIGSIPKRTPNYMMRPADHYAACARGCGACDFDGTCPLTQAHADSSPTPPPTKYVLPPWNSTKYMHNLTQAVLNYVQVWTLGYDARKVKKWLTAGNVKTAYSFVWTVSFTGKNTGSGPPFSASGKPLSMWEKFGDPAFTGQNLTCIAKRLVVANTKTKYFLAISKAACQSGDRWVTKRSLDRCMRARGVPAMVFNQCAWYQWKGHCKKVANKLEAIDCSDVSSSTRRMLGIN